MSNARPQAHPRKKEYADRVVNITHWGLPILEEGLNQLEQIVKSAVEEVLTIASEDSKDVTFSWMYGSQRKAGATPAMLSMVLPIGETEGEGPSFNYDLKEAVEHEIETVYTINDGSYAKELNEIGIELKRLGQELIDKMEPYLDQC